MHKLVAIHIKTIPDCDPDTSYLEQEGFEDRLRQYQKELFYFVGIRAEATIVGEDSHILQFITSAGLWGIESDSDEEHLKEVAKDEVQVLKNELVSLGVKWKEDLAYQTINSFSI